MHRIGNRWKSQALGIAVSLVLSSVAFASSHMDAPAITLDDSANTTDVYAFRAQGEDGTQYLTTALAVYPFEEPGIGPNAYQFDDKVRYEIHVALDDDVDRGVATLTYRFEFDTKFRNRDTILQTYFPFDGLTAAPQPPAVGEFANNQNRLQDYKVTLIDRRNGGSTQVLGNGAKDGLIVPLNNQGLQTPFYNQGNNGDNRAKEGVQTRAALDPYTRSAIAELPGDYEVFAGQRDDGFYADIQSIFDLDFLFGRATGTPTKPFDSQGGFNVHMIGLNIPLSVLGNASRAGVYATTSRQIGIFWAQVGRQGNPLFAEGLVAVRDKNLYNATPPFVDAILFDEYVDPVTELAVVLGQVFQTLGLGDGSPLQEVIPGLVRSIFIPDLIKVDLTTGPARTPNDPAFSRLSIFGGDTFPNGAAGGWPNGRRFGDDVVDIALLAIGVPPIDAAGNVGVFPDDLATTDIDRVNKNDITYNDVFPYAATPLNGRNHGHHDEGATP